MRDLFKKIIITLLSLEARAVLRKYRPRIVAVTGSVGKTSTKDAIYSVLSPRTHVRKSEKSFNSEIGLPLTILGCPNGWGNPLRWMQNLIDGLFLILFPSRYPEWLVLEVGADRPGDIRSLSSWLRVDVAVITRLPEVPVHVEFFDSPEALREEKASLIKALRRDGVLVVFYDDNTRMLAARAEGREVITFGLSQEADVRAEQAVALFGADGYPVGMSSEMVVGSVRTSFEIQGTAGAHALLPPLAALAVGKALGRRTEDMFLSLAKYVPPAGRMRLLKGIKGTLVVDDSYNSSPAAASAALQTLSLLALPPGAKRKKGRRIAILGDMLELGRHAFEEHRKLGREAKEHATILVTVGFRARDIAQGALDAGMKEDHIFQFEDAAKAGEEIAAQAKEGDIILCKGSQSVRMEKAVELLMEQPERAGELLVRQDEEWKKR